MNIAYWILHKETSSPQGLTAFLLPAIEDSTALTEPGDPRAEHGL